jgi:hypothetical protein
MEEMNDGPMTPPESYRAVLNSRPTLRRAGRCGFGRRGFASSSPTDDRQGGVDENFQDKFEPPFDRGRARLVPQNSMEVFRNVW